MPFSSVGRRRFSTRVQTQSARRHPEALRLLRAEGPQPIHNATTAAR